MYPLSIGLVIETKALWDDLQRALTDLPVRVVLEQSDIADWPSFLEKLGRMRPDVLLIDVAGVKTMLEEAVQRIRSIPAPPAMFALHSGADPELILRTLRSGASEYLFPPFKDPLRAALERISADRNRQQQGVKPPEERCLASYPPKAAAAPLPSPVTSAAAPASRTRKPSSPTSTSTPASLGS